MKKILFDASNANISTSSGVGLATLAYLNAVIELSLGELDVIQCIGDGFEDDKIFNTIRAHNRSKIQAILKIPKGLFSVGSEKILSLIKNTHYDIAFLNSGFIAGGIVEQLRSKGIIVCILHHNFEPEYTMDSKSPFTLFGNTPWLVSHWEKRGYIHANINLFLTNQDKDLFELHYGKHTNNFVLGMFEPKTSKKPELINPKPNTLAITCSLNAEQNIFMIKRLDGIFEILKRDFPAWSVVLMGRNPTKEILKIQNRHNNIRVIPNPNNIQIECASQSIYWCPMDLGGGIKLRLMDGLRNGMPVITHKVSARGYDMFLGKPYFSVYNDNSEFIDTFAKFSANKELNYSIRQSIQNDYYKFFSFSSGVARLEQAISNIV